MTEILSFKVKKLIHETPDAITLILEEEHGKKIPYLPGQFLTLLIDVGGKELRRSYSLCSAPGIDPLLSITIKRVANGEVSRYLIDHLKEGDTVKSLRPSGRFIFNADSNKQRDVFLIGAGSGIAPLFSILKYCLFREPLSKITLIDINKNEKTSFYWQELKKLEQNFKNQLEIIHLFSDPDPEMKHYMGRLNIGSLEVLVKKTLKFSQKETQFFVCGPFAFMRMVRMTLIYMGFEEHQIHKENFASRSDVQQIPSPSFPDQKVKLIFKNTIFDFTVPSGKTVLEAALEEGINVPYSCQAGICSICAALCTKGKVKMKNNEVLTEKEIKTGLVLTCVGYPETEDVILDFDHKQSQ